MKSLIKRIITQSGIEPAGYRAEVKSEQDGRHLSYLYENPDDKFLCKELLYTEADLYEIAEKVAKAWAVEKVQNTRAD